MTDPAPTPQQPCTQPEASQFDFWIGTWDLTWGDDGRGTNQIDKILGECVIREQFDGGDSMPLRGLSVSTFDARRGQWFQTWVDNQGSYLDFAGGMAGDRMILARDAVIEGQPVKQRMVWSDITANALEWRWERSDDGGATWRTLWHIHYRRAEA